MIDVTEAQGDRLLVSVIVPAFNDADGLRRCLEALDGRTLRKDRFEVLVVDNGSHPPLAPVVAPFDDGLLSSGDREWGNRLIAAGYVLRYAAQCTFVHPARRTIRSLVDKRRRVEGGVRRMWNGTGALATRPAATRRHPPRSSLAFSLLSDPQTFGRARREGLRVLLLAGILVAVRIAEGLRLRLGGHPVR